MTVRTLSEITAELQALKPTLKERFKVETIDIFGSYARGQQNEKSDVDLLVTYCEPVSFFVTYDLQNYLRRKLRVKVDVVSKKFVNPYIKSRVLQEAIAV